MNQKHANTHACLQKPAESSYPMPVEDAFTAEL